ncbi:PepSY domain-containing protein [Caballeronia sp. DA-9]|uniref:PepSY domain-containing protein n=1 Tax=Caballeronia sp. DA-9 TaxID=3436237 RepID=UPI003F67B2C3
MLKKTGIAAVAVLALAASSAGFARDQPGADWISKDAAISKVKALGHDAVRLEADDGRWEGEATKQGQFYDIHVDPHSGALTRNELKR